MSGCDSGSESFALMVLGDSMVPEFNEGEIIVVEPDGATRDGSFVLAFVGEAPLVQARLVTCLGEGRFQSVNLFETGVPPLRNAPQPGRFTF